MAQQYRYPDFPSTTMHETSQHRSMEELVHVRVDSPMLTQQHRRTSMRPRSPTNKRLRPRQYQNTGEFSETKTQNATLYHHFNTEEQEQQRDAPWLDGLDSSFGGERFSTQIHRDMLWNDMSSGIDFAEFSNVVEDDVQSVIHYELQRDEDEDEDEDEFYDEDEDGEKEEEQEDEEEREAEVPVCCGLLVQVKARLSRARDAITAVPRRRAFSRAKIE